MHGQCSKAPQALTEKHPCIIHLQHCADKHSQTSARLLFASHISSFRSPDRCKDRFKHLIEQQGLLRDFSQFFGTKSVKPSSSTEPNLRLETSSPAMKYDSQQHSDACWTSLRRQKTYDAHLPAQVDPAHFKAPNHTHTSINCPPRTHRAICRCHEPNSGFGSQHHEACCRLSSVVEAH